MMSIEKQVTNPTISKRLKEMLVRQSSYFFWVDGALWDETMQSDYESPMTPSRDKWVSAFTVAELGEMLPRYTKCWQWHDLDKVDDKGKEGKPYWNCEHEEFRAQETANTEADARGKMLIYLLEKELI